jgi:hypothetical protein
MRICIELPLQNSISSLKMRLYKVLLSSADNVARDWYNTDSSSIPHEYL